MATFDELYLQNDVDAILEKAKEKCEAKLRGKRFAGWDKDDVLQEVLIKVFRTIDRYKQDTSRYSTFVDHVMDNMIKDCYRKTLTEKNLNVVNAAEYVDAYLDEDDVQDFSVGCHVGVVDNGYQNSEFVTDLMQNMGLSEREKDIFSLRSAGYEFVEIASIIGVTKARISQIWKGIVQKHNAL